MCTMTLIPVGESQFRFGFNRDESRTRVFGLPPQRRFFANRMGIAPIDPESNGTWFAVNDRGLVGAILNVNLPDQPRVKKKSRGGLIPDVLGLDSLAEAQRSMRSLTVSEYAPFRLVLFQVGQLAAFFSDGQTLLEQEQRVTKPLMFTSSGLGDHLVEGPRRSLFAEMLINVPGSVTEQEAYHRHSWPDRPELSVCMRRDTARTVSYTTLELTATEAMMNYFSGPPDEPCDTHMARLVLETPIAV